MSQALVLAGAQIVVANRDRGRAEQSAMQIGRNAVGIEMHVRGHEPVRAGIEEVHKRLGGLDPLVNNAGIGMRTVNPGFLSEPQSFWRVPPEGSAMWPRPNSPARFLWLERLFRASCKRPRGA
jgi:NAD(P)-dependent dehydrogenase (short-subunit alcohol dehydrogenase family)